MLDIDKNSSTRATPPSPGLAAPVNTSGSPRFYSDDQEEDDLRAFRGMLLGSVIGLVFWAVLYVIWLVAS